MIVTPERTLYESDTGVHDEPVVGVGGYHYISVSGTETTDIRVFTIKIGNYIADKYYGSHRRLPTIKLVQFPIIEVLLESHSPKQRLPPREVMNAALHLTAAWKGDPGINIERLLESRLGDYFDVIIVMFRK